MTKQLSFGTETLIELTKKNAPYIYQKWVCSQIDKLKNQLNKLRDEYRYATIDKKKEIEEKGKSIKQEIIRLQSEL